MSRRWLLSLLCLSVAIVAIAFAQLAAASAALRVNEAATRFLIQDQTIVQLEVVNPASQNLPVRLKLELLSPTDTVRGLGVRDLTLQPGINTLTIPLTLTAHGLNEEDDEALPWYRLRYRITPTHQATAAPDEASGLISLSQIDTPDIFALEVSASGKTHRGGRHYTHVRAFNPITLKPVKDVSADVTVELDDNPGTILRGAGVTDANGYALVSLNIPAQLDADEGELKVTARHGGFVQSTSDDIELSDQAQIMVTTDKPIYQPGQPLHVRTLIFDSSRHAAANAEATLKITDPESTNVFQTTLHTSRFGVASADWTIPDNTRLGDYTIKVEMDGEIYDNSQGYQKVKISRYDLPNFTVNVKPDRTYYLPQQNADVEVKADYLFGQPVKRGQVRVTREEERDWNFREQKWDITAGVTFAGETDDAGRFVAHIDLKQDHEELLDEEYSRFKDLHYAAYFTDPTTNRTEQRRFDLRVTKDAIHVYVVEGRYRQAKGFPFQFYVSTSFADGTPAPCEVEISQSVGDNERPVSGPVLKTIQTNKYGVAKLTALQVPGDGDYPSLNFLARTGNGFTGRHTESFYYPSVPVIRVETNKVLYGPGDVIEVTLRASQPEMNAIVDVSRQTDFIESRSISLHEGTATFKLRYRPEFRDEVTIAAYSKSFDDAGRYDFPFASRTVLFPRERDLKLNVRLDHAEYKPGEDATVDFHLTSPDGRPASSALGIVIFDRAVEERARTEQEFGGRFGFSGSFSQFLGYDNQVGGITRKDLQRIDPAKPLPEGIELAAEILLDTGDVRPQLFRVKGFETDHAQTFARLTSLHLKPLEDLLGTEYREGGIYPANGESLRRLLFEAGVDFDQLRDPWGTLYREAFSIEQSNSVLQVISAGPDKVFATRDDFIVSRTTRPYFRFTGEAISRAVGRFHARTGGFIRQAATLKTELQSEGIEFDSLRDPWGQPYSLSFTISQNKFNVAVRSSGPNQRFEVANLESDDFTLWLTSIDYLTETRPQIERALDEYFTATNDLPRNDDQLQRAFTTAAIQPDKLIDPWGHRFYAVYKTESRYANRAVIRNVATYGQQATGRTEITPVTQHVSSIRLRSSGADGKAGTVDDFEVATVSQITGEDSSDVQIPTRPSQQVFFGGAKGAIRGTITDVTGAVVSGVRVTATIKNTSQEFDTETDDTGRFLLRNLPVGVYEVRCSATGFQVTIFTEVPVNSSNVTTLDVRLQVGTVSSTVEITGSSEATLNMTSSSVSQTVTETRLRGAISQPLQLATPRLREYFPETLVWQPALETDKQGRAQLKFKLADNITTWKMSVIGSNEAGEIGTAETEIKSFQPFFVEHDPPRVLTEGDQISLPVVLRNYLERAQTVDLDIKAESWFTLQGPARQRAIVPAGDSSRQTFDLKAVASVKDGQQRVTARGFEASDAIEKPVTVHPDGEEKTQTASDILGDSASLVLNLPPSVIPGSRQAELKIYPSLMAHVLESIEGILERPHGCGEQTISSTYPSLLVLRRNQELGADSAMGRTAKRYAQLGYERLLNYRSEDGGFTYWGRGEADLALTAYALRFLHDAAPFVAVDGEVVKAARLWLIKQQRADGSWSEYDSNHREAQVQRQSALLTAFVARVLAMTESLVKGEASTAKASARTVSPELKRTLTYLSTKIDAIDEPHLIAQYALAAIAAGETQGATRAIAKLRTLAHADGDTTYWALETNTPFHGWGLAGRVETTALAVQALTRFANTQSGQMTPSLATNDQLVRRGLLFLLRQKDRYGVWYSTQATINVLDTLVTLLASETPGKLVAAASLEIVVNGQPATSLTLPSGNKNTALIRADLSRFLQSGTNHVELRRPAGAALATVQLVANYYVPWSETTNTPASPGDNGSASSLRLTATFDKTAATINEDIVCHVKAERLGSHGYGMILAEIGLPPGADVDRASLESAMKSSAWAIGQYDILPDRVVVYLWPSAGSINFDFKFRPRFALTAKTAPSVVYDYYNPEARAVVAPVQFVVR